MTLVRKERNQKDKGKEGYWIKGSNWRTEEDLLENESSLLLLKFVKLFVSFG